MIPLLLAATLALAPEHRVADLRPGATNADERVLAIDAARAITFRTQDRSIRAVPFADPSKATTLDSGLVDRIWPVAAPPLIAWTDGDRRTHIAPIDAPERGTLVAGDVIQSMQCNAKACLAAGQLQLILVRLDGTPYAHLPRGGAIVLAADPDGFLVGSSPTSVMRIDNSGETTFTATTPQQASGRAAADFDGDRYVFVWPDDEFTNRMTTLRALSIGFGGDAGPPATLASVPAAIYDRIGIAYNAGRHLLVFGEADPYFAFVLPGDVGPNHLDALRLDRALQPLDPAPIIVNDTPWADLFPAVVSRGSGFVVAWSHGPGLIFSGDPEAAEVDADGHVGPRMILSAGLVPQSVSSMATLPGALLVGYLEYPHEDGAPTLRVGRFGPEGTPLGAPLVVAAAAARQSAMAARGSDVLVVWETDAYKVNAAILHPDGSLQSVSLPSLSGALSVAASRNGWMIAIAGFSGSVSAVRVDAAGAASAPQTIVALDNIDFDAAVASDGDRFLVAWATDGGVGSTLCNFVPCGTRATLLDASGGVLASDIQIAPRRDLAGATFAGGEYFVASTTGVRLNRDGVRVGDANVHASRVAPFGNAVLAVVGAPDATLVVIDHGVAGAEAALGAVAPVEITSGGVAYNVKAGGETAVVFRQIIPDRRRAAYH